MCLRVLHAQGNTVSTHASCTLHLNGLVATLRQYHSKKLPHFLGCYFTIDGPETNLQQKGLSAHRAANQQNLWSGHFTLVLSPQVLTGALNAMQSPELDEEQLRMHSIIRSLLRTEPNCLHTQGHVKTLKW